ncbi:hypothetical protein CEXT_464351 [Caerostris extrusa]|uniref:LAGLIDADG homing endonuclease n=1 Tax=Caerostris extrusa TaxID=172846 RepID=A0AAV4QZ70_CAEEX|nr:hypothetical protein CEXT_464351 [Caerostris extrusa]
MTLSIFVQGNFSLCKKIPAGCGATLNEKKSAYHYTVCWTIEPESQYWNSLMTRFTEFLHHFVYTVGKLAFNSTEFEMRDIIVNVNLSRYRFGSNLKINVIKSFFSKFYWIQTVAFIGYWRKVFPLISKL